jgi:hypothetical protein
VDAGGPLGERVRALVATGVPDPQVWGTFAGWLIEKGLVTRADMDAWARLPWETAARVRVQAVRNAKLFPPAEALQVLAEVIASQPKRSPGNTGSPGDQQNRDLHWLFEALTGLLPELPWPESRDEVARLLGPIWRELSRWGQFFPVPSDRQLEAMGRAFELAREPELIMACGNAWVQYGAGRPGGHETLFRWAREGALVSHRSRARLALFPLLDERELDEAVDLLVKPETVDDDLLSAWQDLMALPQGGAVVGSPARVWRLLDRIAAVPQAEGGRAEKLAIHLFQPIQRERVPPTVLLDLWLEQPERFPRAFLSTQRHNLPKLLANSGHLPALRRAFRERWAAASAAQREGLLAGLGVLDPRADAELLDFLRGELSAQPRRIPATWRYSVIARLLKLTVADIRAFYDLTQPEEVDEAASWVTRTQDAPTLEATPEAFEALRLAFRPDGPQAQPLTAHFARFESIQRPLLEALLAHGDAGARHEGVRLLITRSSPTDADLWVKALTDPQVAIRSSAAQELKRVPTAVTIKALVGALDDPHPDVRAAALASLESIQKMEELKARWREKVK